MTPIIGRDTSKDINVREGAMIATVVHCDNLKGYPLPGHSKKLPNAVKSKADAEYYAQRVLNEMVKGEV